MKKTNLGINDDYATMYTRGDSSPWDEDSSKISFYYGYEMKSDDGEWLFAVSQNENILKTYTTSQIKAHTDDNLRNMSDYLLVGINMYLNGV